MTKKLFRHRVHSITFVESVLERCNALIAEGQQVSSFSSDGTSMSFYNGIPLDELMSQAAEFLDEAYYYQANGITPRRRPIKKTIGRLRW